MNILIINAHPSATSYCEALCESYRAGAMESGFKTEELVLREMQFDLNLTNGFSRENKLEPDIQFAQKKIKEAGHIVIVHPVWWGSVPALLKGFIDRVFLPGFAFKYRENSVWWDKLLSGRTARIIYTSDTPPFIYKYVYGAPSVKQLKKRTLEFCGISSVKTTSIGPLRKSNAAYRNAQLQKVKQLGRLGK